jgi:CRP/FNR family cyclic AMP-dependent transcriptional regulator
VLSDYLMPSMTGTEFAKRMKEKHPHTPFIFVPSISQETLAEMIGSTRSRVNFFMNRFRKLGFIDYNGGLIVRSSLLGVVLHD